MKDGWLWLSILKTQARPSPMSMTPAFSPGPWMTQGALVGSVRRCSREDLYEQCSFHIAENMPSSVKVGSRSIRSRTRCYSSGLRPCSATSAGVISGSFRGKAMSMSGAEILAFAYLPGPPNATQQARGRADLARVVHEPPSHLVNF